MNDKKIFERKHILLLGAAVFVLAILLLWLWPDEHGNEIEETASSAEYTYEEAEQGQTYDTEDIEAASVNTEDEEDIEASSVNTEDEEEVEVASANTEDEEDVEAASANTEDENEIEATYVNAENEETVAAQNTTAQDVDVQEATAQDITDDIDGSDNVAAYDSSCLAALVHTEIFTNSAIEHIFMGTCRNNNASGYHYEGITDSPGRTVPGTASSPNQVGVYTAQVEVNGVPKGGNGGYSSFYPMDLSPQEIVDLINEAYAGRVYIRGNTYSGMTSAGIEISMYLDENDKVISAFPVY